MEALLDHGEGLLVPERMIVAPTVGVFRPVELPEAGDVAQGQTVGMVDGPEHADGRGDDHALGDEQPLTVVEQRVH